MQGEGPHNKDNRHTIQKVDSIKDLGILFDTRLNFKDHIQEKINKAYNMCLLKRNFIHVDCYTLILLYKALVRPHLEYANSYGLLIKNVTLNKLKKYKGKLYQTCYFITKIPIQGTSTPSKFIHIKVQKTTW